MRRAPLLALSAAVALLLGAAGPGADCGGCSPCEGASFPGAADGCGRPDASLTADHGCCTNAGGEQPATHATRQASPPAPAALPTVLRPPRQAPPPGAGSALPGPAPARALDRCTLFSSLLI